MYCLMGKMILLWFILSAKMVLEQWALCDCPAAKKGSPLDRTHSEIICLDMFFPTRLSTSCKRLCPSTEPTLSCLLTACSWPNFSAFSLGESMVCLSFATFPKDLARVHLNAVDHAYLQFLP